MRYIDALVVPPDALGPFANEGLRDFNPGMVEKFSSKFSIFSKISNFGVLKFFDHKDDNQAVKKSAEVLV